MDIIDNKLQQSYFRQVFIFTLQAATLRSKVDNAYENLGLGFDIVDELLTYKISFPRQIGKTFLLKAFREKYVSTGTDVVEYRDIFFIDSIGGLGADGNGSNYFVLNNQNEYDKLKQIIEETPNRGYVFVIDNCYSNKIDALKSTIKDIFESVSKKFDKNFYPSFILIE